MNRPMTYAMTASILCAFSGAMLLGQRGGASSAPSGAGTIPSTNANRSSFPMGGSTDPFTGPNGLPDPLARRTSELQEKTRNNERQKRLESDTEKLVGLVTDLKSQVESDKALSPAELSKRAEEIEKLARSVKDKMRG